MLSKPARRPKSPPLSDKPKRPKRRGFSRAKGARFECELVNRLKEVGLDAVRVPLSGMGHEKRENDEFAGDIVLPWVDGTRVKFEAKKRASGFSTIYRWLGKHRGLFIAADRKETLVVFRLSDFAELMRDKGRLDGLEGLEGS